MGLWRDAGLASVSSNSHRRSADIDDHDQPRPRLEEDGQHFYRSDAAAWDRLRSRLSLGQRLTGTVVWVPQPGVIGIGIDLGLPVGGFVDVLHLPRDHRRWPAVGITTDFILWWVDERPQIRLVPTEPQYRREDFTTWLRHEQSPAAAILRTRGGTTTQP